MGGGAGKEKQAIFNTPGDNRPESNLICRGGGMGVTMLLWRFRVGITIIPEPVCGGKIGLVPVLYVEGEFVYRDSTVKMESRWSQKIAVTRPIPIRAQR